MFNSFIVGIVQGLSEFLPISSSGHVIFFESLLGFNEGKGFAAAIHLGTCIAAIIYFRSDVSNILKSFLLYNRHDEIHRVNRTLGFKIIIATIPAAILALCVSKLGLDEIFSSLTAVGLASIVFAAILMYADKIDKTQNAELTYWNSFVIGTSQVIAAIFSGASRSGVTLSVSYLFKLEKEIAAKFIFLISIPITGLAAINEIFIKKSVDINSDLMIAFVAALISGLVAIKFLLYFVRHSKLQWLIYYRFVFGIICILYGITR